MKRPVTIYTRGDSGLRKNEGDLLTHGECTGTTQWPFARYFPFGKRKPVQVTAHDPYNFLLILEGTGHPDPPSVESSVEDGNPRPNTYNMLDPRAVVSFNKIINPHQSLFIADYRYNKTEEFTEEDLDWLRVIEPSFFPALPRDSGGAESKELLEDSIEDFLDGEIKDDREKKLTSVVQRFGQDDFRRKLLDAYGSRCPVTGCNVSGSLQAAHIVPYFGPRSNQVPNGLPLRADIHNLFDLYLLSIDPQTMTVRIAPDLIGTMYGELDNKPIEAPANIASSPSREALRRHYQNFLEGRKVDVKTSPLSNRSGSKS